MDNIEARMNQMIRNCRLCKMGHTRRNVAIVRGARHPTILFVGEGPGKYEELTGLPFKGPSGKRLDAEIGRVGIPAEICCYVLLVKCRPITDDGINRPPTDLEIACCRPFLEEQIDFLKPQIIVAVGRLAQRAIKHHKPLYIMHPAAVVHDADLMDEFQADVQRIKDALNALPR